MRIEFPSKPAPLAALPPLSLYVHVPWCVRKCPYCDFNSHEIRDGDGRALSAELEARYLDALTADLDAALADVWGRKVYTIFFGGGTPSLLSPRTLDAILSMIRARLAVTPEAEITLEANPGTFEAEKFAQFRALGVNRLSIGIQSFDPAHLKALGRIHDRDEALRAVEIAHANFDNFNLDLMYALPGQSLEQALADIDRAIALAPTHLSAYHLTIEPNTVFHRFPPKVPDDELSATMQEAIEARLSDAGYVHYETSAFAKPAHECKHNLNYWRFGDYLGIGAGAHGKISLPTRIFRTMRYKNPREYMDRALGVVPSPRAEIQTDGAGAHPARGVAPAGAVHESHDVAPADLPFEFMMNALRLIDGFPLRLFEERTGLSRAMLLAPLDKAESLGLIERDLENVRPTLRGQRFLNDLLQIFLPK